jgi:flagellar protein FliS
MPGKLFKHLFSMQTNPYNNYLETKVLFASPLELVTILYTSAIEALGLARGALAAADAPERASVVSRASAVLMELIQSLDRDNGGELARQLIELYDYILRRIQQGHACGEDQPFSEAIQLLTTLLDGWNQVLAANAHPMDPQTDPNSLAHCPY